MYLKLNRTLPEIMYWYARNQASRGIDMQICAIEELILNWDYSLSYHSNENSNIGNTWPESAKIDRCGLFQREYYATLQYTRLYQSSIFGGVMTV
jgi:hypothetical protein